MGGILGGTPLGALVLGGVNQTGAFNPIWAINVNAVIQVKRIDQ